MPPWAGRGRAPSGMNTARGSHATLPGPPEGHPGTGGGGYGDDAASPTSEKERVGSEAERWPVLELSAGSVSPTCVGAAADAKSPPFHTAGAAQRSPSTSSW